MPRRMSQYMSQHMPQLVQLILALSILSATMPAQARLPANACFDASGQQFSSALSCYRQAQALLPLRYSASGVTQLPTAQKRSFALLSQSWSPNGMVTPAQWKHDVDIYIPTNALPGRALLVANNGINYADAAGLRGISDFTPEMALNIATKTHTIVISVSNIPNQYLTYADDGVARREDDSVAHSWKLFLDQPDPFMSLHMPMMASLVKAMDLAQKELQPWQIKHFIASGASKRAWAVWLAAIADTRIDAIAPFVIDILGMDKVLDHTYAAYGNSWPLAFKPYLNEKIIAQRTTENFNKLMQIEDPLRYLDSPYAERLAIPKYIVNASGDDFFLPDNASFYFDRLPGAKALRVAPNSNHQGIRRFVEEALIPFTNRLQQARALPTMAITQSNDTLMLNFSETPINITQWRADNHNARDFRYACGIRYEATDITAASSVSVTLETPSQGWRATFVEARFADGLVITTPVTVLPKRYPMTTPPSDDGACKTLAN